MRSKRPIKHLSGLAVSVVGLTLTGFALSGHNVSAQAFSLMPNPHTEMLVVKFRADWCGPCHIMEPSLDNALRSLNDPSLRLLSIDTTNGATSIAAAHTAFDADIVSQYNQWLGVTGFAVIIDADTKNTLGCVNMTYSPDMMATHIANLKGLALSNKASMDLTCPAPNRR